MLRDVARDVPEASLCYDIGVARRGVEAEDKAGDPLAELVQTHSLKLRGASHRRHERKDIRRDAQDERLIQLQLQPQGPRLSEPMVRKETLGSRPDLLLDALVRVIVEQVRAQEKP